MMEYFTLSKLKQRQVEKRAARQEKYTPVAQPAPTLSRDDEDFLTRIISAEGTPPALPERHPILDVPVAGVPCADYQGQCQGQLVVATPESREAPRMTEGERKRADKGDKKAEKALAKAEKKARAEDKEGVESPRDKKRFSDVLQSTRDRVMETRLAPSFMRRGSAKASRSGSATPDEDGSVASTPGTPGEASREDDLTRVLDELSLGAVNSRAFSLSAESQELVQKFTVVLKDLVNGVPTAYDDLTHLLDSSQGTLAKSYDHLPGFMQKLVTQLPQKLTTTLAPELLAAATEAQGIAAGAVGLGAEEVATKAGLKSATLRLLKPTSLKDLVTKPGAVATMLKAIMNALKLRWPAFMGTNVLLSLALFVLLFVFWYCHKRGKEVRLAQLKQQADAAADAARAGDARDGDAAHAGESSPDEAAAPEASNAAAGESSAAAAVTHRIDAPPAVVVHGAADAGASALSAKPVIRRDYTVEEPPE